MMFLFAAGCGGNPFDSDTASSSVQFNLEGARTSGGAFLCSEADLAQLSTTPSGNDLRTDSRTVSGNCTPSFSVTVPKGNVSFVGELMGRGRPLMRGRRLDFPANKDGFRVVIDLEEIPALNLRVETLGLGGPEFYEYEVEGSGGTRVPIGRNATDSVPALAAGERTVTLWGACGVEDGPVHDVMIPTAEAERDSTVFRVDCNQSGNVKIVVTTQGPGGPPAYMVDVGDKLMNNIRPNDSITVSGVTPGPIDIVLDVKDPICTPNDITSVQPHFLPSGGALRVEFVVLCVQDPQQTGAIRVVTTQVGSGPTPGAKFDVTVRDSAGFRQIGTLGPPAADSRTFIELSIGPATVMLTPSSRYCVVLGSGTQTVRVPKPPRVAVVTFMVEC